MAARDPDKPSPAVMLLGGIVATIVARKTVSIIWVAATGHKAPKDATDPGLSTSEAVAFAMASAAFAGAARFLVYRKTGDLKARSLRAAAGDLEPVEA
jgi:Protein of unknown function (DUF4235)